MDFNTKLFEAQRWGIPLEAVSSLGERLYKTWERFHSCFTTSTRDTSENALVYIKGQLLMDKDRNYKNIARRINGIEDDGQSLQHFMSESPWNHQDIFEQIQEEIRVRPSLHQGMLTLDDSGEQRWGDGSAGVKKQYLGRMGKIEKGQVGVALGYYHPQQNFWAMVDAALFLPESCFKEEYQAILRRGYAPEDLEFATKLEMGLEMIDWAVHNQLPFEIIGFDTWYGRDSKFRAALSAKNLIYMADVPCNQQVYLSLPKVGIPPQESNQRGRPCTMPRVLNEVEPIAVSQLLEHPLLKWEYVEVRQSERGMLGYPCAASLVWTLTEDAQVRQEWLLVSQQVDGTFRYSLSNASPDSSLKQLASWHSMRHFAERIFEDSKNDMGWDELEAGKYRAWYHHTALTALALWFVAEVKLDWAQKYPRDETLLPEIGLQKLPCLSTANIRELLKSVMPLKQFSPKEASIVVIQHLLNRSFSTASRLRTQNSS